MHLTIDEVRRIASLAGLRVGPEEARGLVVQMGEIVRFVEEMGEPEEGRDAEEPASELTVREEEDRPRPGLDRGGVLTNAPDHRHHLIRVAPVRPEWDGTRNGEEP